MQDVHEELTVVLPQASAELWPDLFAQPAVQERREEILNKMRIVRPVVETGCALSQICR